MEEKAHGKRTTPPSIPANYVSIIQLQERWNNERARKRKEEEEAERPKKLQVEEELKKAKDVGGKRDEEEKRFDRSNWTNWGKGRSISKEKEHMNGGEARCGEKEEPAVKATIGSGGGEDTAVTSNEGLLPKKMRGFRRKRYDGKKKKKTQDVAVVEDIVVDDGCRSIVATESNTPVKDKILVHRKKGEILTGEKSVGSREKAVTAIETQFEDLSIKRSIYRNQRVKMPIGAASKMVWVKKEQNERAVDRIAMMP